MCKTGWFSHLFLVAHWSKLLSTAHTSELRAVWWESPQWTRVLPQLGNASENLRCYMKALRVPGCPLSIRWAIQVRLSPQWKTLIDRGGWRTNSSFCKKFFSSPCGDTTLLGLFTNLSMQSSWICLWVWLSIRLSIKRAITLLPPHTQVL